MPFFIGISYVFQSATLLSAWLTAHVCLDTLRCSPALMPRRYLKSFGYRICVFLSSGGQGAL